MFGLRLLPEREVHLIALLAHTVELAAGIAHILQVAAGEHAIFMVGIVFHDVEIHTAVRHIGIAVVENLLHEFLLLDDVSRGVRLDAGGQYAEARHGSIEAVGVILRHLHRFELFEPSLLRYLVFALIGIMLQMSHIGYVAHIAHLVAYVLQIAEEAVKGDGRACVSEMGIAIDRRAADVHSHAPFMQRFEEFLLARQRVIYE